jgi:hypothetical protein
MAGLALAARMHQQQQASAASRNRFWFRSEGQTAAAQPVSVLEIMHHCVALPWNTKTGSPPRGSRPPLGQQ